MEYDSNPKASFLLYTVLYHEVTAISLLEIILYHQNSCESLDDINVDLIDYCMHSCTQLIGLINSGYNQNDEKDLLKESTSEEWDRQYKEMVFQIGLKCIPVLTHLIDSVDVLPLGAQTRLVKTHDMPCIFSELLQLRPWMRKGKDGFEKYREGKWENFKGDQILKLTKVEAQTWIGLRQLLLNSNLMQSYPVNDFRQRELGKLSGLLNEQLLDQLPILAELKHLLCTLQISGQTTSDSTSLVIEELPKVNNNILKSCKKYGWENIFIEHKRIFIELDQPDVVKIAQRLNSIYNIDFFVRQDSSISTENSCNKCQKPAEKKCGNCQTIYYCSVECQKHDWLQHKPHCSKIN